MNKLIFFIITFLAFSISAEDFVIDNSSQSDTVYFRSTAKLEFIEGKTTAIDGYFSIDLTDNSDISGIIRVDLRSLKTGIDTRDGHMRDRHLHTKKYPYAYFELQALQKHPGQFIPDSTYNFETSGKFYIHNGYRPLKANVSATLKKPVSGREYFDVRVAFEMKLDEYKIERPKALFLKLAETIELEVIFKAYKGLEKQPISLPGWPETR